MRHFNTGCSQCVHSEPCGTFTKNGFMRVTCAKVGLYHQPERTVCPSFESKLKKCNKQLKECFKIVSWRKYR
jgi:hypothetical protein